MWNLLHLITKFLPLFLFVVFADSARVAAQAKPQYGAWGFDLAGADRETKPGNDFFRFANGKWIDQTQIPPDKPAYSLRLAISDKTEQQLRELLESLGSQPSENETTSLGQKAGAFYRSFMDEAAVEKLGAK